MRRFKLAIFNALNVKEGEGSKVALLLTHSFFIGVFLSLLFTAGNALFLDQFGREHIPKAFLASGVVGLVYSILFSRIQARISFNRLVLLNLIFVFGLIAGFRFMLGSSDSKWIAFGLFIWVQPIFAMIYLGFWGIVGGMFDLRQGKRLFGLISSGEVVASILAYFSVPIILKFIETSDLLIIALVGLALCVPVLLIIISRYGGARSKRKADKTEKPPASFPELLKNRYFILMSLFTVGVIFSFYFIDYAFLAVARARFPEKAQLAQFIGIFFGTIKIFDFVIKTFLYNRLISQFGLRFGLIFLPALMAACTAAASFIGTYETAGIFFFLFISLNKLFERGLRKSVTDPSFKILYQPLGAEQRTSIQTKVEGIVWQLASFLAGLILLVLGFLEGFKLVHSVYLLFLVVIAWIFVVILLYREYHGKLKQHLTKISRHVKVQKTPFDEFRERLLDANQGEVITSLNLLEKIDPTFIEPLIAELLNRPEPALISDLLSRIERMRAVTAADLVQKFALEYPDPAIQEQARRTLQSLEQARNFTQSTQQIVELARSSLVADREFAARIIGNYRKTEMIDVLLELMRDESPVVSRVAMGAATQLNMPALWPTVVEMLSSTRRCNAAISALVTIGEPVLPELEKAFNQFGQNPQTQVRIIRVYGRIGGTKAKDLLLDKINYPDKGIRNQVLQSLTTMNYRPEEDEVPLIKKKIEEVVSNEVWVMAALLDLGQEKSVQQLQETMGQEIDYNRSLLFQLLSYLYDPKSIELVRDNVTSGDSEELGYALEIIDVFASPDLKQILFPLFDDLTLAQRIKRLDEFFPQQRLSRIERIKDIINRDYTRVSSWTKANAIYTLAQLSPQELSNDIIANIFNPDPMLRETAAWAVRTIQADRYAEYATRMNWDDQQVLDQVFRKMESGKNGGRPYLTIDKVAHLKTVRLLSELPETVLAKMMPFLDEYEVGPQTTIIEKGDTSNDVYVIAQGEVRVHDGDTTFIHLHDWELVGEMAVLSSEPRTASVTAVADSYIFRFKGDRFLELVVDHIEATREIIRLLNKYLLKQTD